MKLSLFPAFQDRKRDLWLLLFAVCIANIIPLVSQAQDGQYLMIHQDHPFPQLDHHNFDIAVDSRAMLCIANRNGVIRYDGHSWDFYRTPSAVFSIAPGPGARLYLACHGAIGYLDRNGQGDYVFEALKTDSTKTYQYKQVVYWQDTALYLSEHHLLFFDQKENTFIPDESVTLPQGEFATIHQLDSAVILQTEDNRLYTWQSGSFLPLETPFTKGGKLNFWALSPNKKASIAGADDGRVALYQDGQWKEFDSKPWMDADYPMAEWVNDSVLALCTDQAGCVLVNPYTASLEQRIDYHGGLPDNEVLAIGKDWEEGLWIAHEFGYSRLSPNVPIRNYAHYSGYEGSTLDVLRYKGKAYLATSLGIYYLDSVNNYKETVYYVPVKEPDTQSGKPTSATAPKRERDKEEGKEKTEEDDKDKKKKGGLFAFLRGKKDKDKEPEPEETSTASATEETDEEEEKKKGLFGAIADIFDGDNDKAEKKDKDKEKRGFLGAIFRSKKEEDKEEKTRYRREIDRELLSTRFVYQRVRGVEGKHRQLIEYKDHLISAGNSGLYDIEDSMAVMISDIPMLGVYYDSLNDWLIARHEHEGLSVYRFTDNMWERLDYFTDFDELITHINRDNEGNLWLAGPSNLYRVDNLRKDDLVLGVYKIPNRYYDEVYAFKHGPYMYFVNSQGYFYYDPQEDKIKKDGNLQAEVGLPEKYIYNSPDFLWVYNKNRWFLLSPDGRRELKETYALLSLFENLSQLVLSPDGEGLWLSTDDNELYFYTADSYTLNTMRMPLVLKEIRNQFGKLLPHEALKVNQDEAVLVFEFVQPDYLGLLGQEYQYQLNGLSESWSDWTASNEVHFNYLPEGSYTLSVRTRNSFGEVHTSEPFTFEVVPPFWRQWWFYLLEIVFFSSLLVLTARLNRVKQTRYAILSRLFTFMTLILILEFLETLVESNVNLQSSPVIDFFVEASIAFLILPVEYLLRRYVIRSEQFVNKSKEEDDAVVTDDVAIASKG